MANYSASIKLSAVTNLNQVSAKIAKSFSVINSRAQIANSSFANLRERTAGMGRSLAIASGVAIAAGAAVFGLAKRVANLGDDLAKTSQKTGINVTDLQRLQYSAELAGGSIVGFNTSMKIFSKSIDQAGQGVKTYQEQFDRLAISVTNSDGTMKDSQSLLMEVADRFAAMEDGATKSAMAQEMFGRSGLDMIPMLNKGSAAIREQGDWLEKHTKLISEDAAKASEEFNDRLLDLKKAFSNITVPLATKLIPKITELAIKMTAFLADIQSFIPVLLKWGKILGVVAIAAAAFFGPLILFNKAKVLWGIVMALKAVITATWGFNAALLANPIGLTIAGIVALGAAIFLLVKHWDTVKAAFVSFGEAWMTGMNMIGDYFRDKFEPIFAAMEKVQGFFSKFGRGKKDTFETLDTSKIIGEAAVQNQTQLDVNMRIDQDGRARVTGAKSDGNLNFNSQMGMMIPQY